MTADELATWSSGEIAGEEATVISRELHGVWRWIKIIFPAIIIILAVIRVFDIRLFGLLMDDKAYHFLL